jgi:hypothetical protein
LVILRRPPDAPDLPEEELDAIQTAHLAHLDGLRAQGSLLVSGPVTDGPDKSLRGLSIMSLTVEETLAVTADDPAVKAHRLVAEVMTWLTPRGDLP